LLAGVGNRSTLPDCLATVVDPGGGSRGSRPDACLKLKFLHGQDPISLFNWPIFLMKHALHFATKLNSRDFKKCDGFWVPSYDLFASALKAVFPTPAVPGVHRLKHMVISVRSNLPHKSSTVLSGPKFGPLQSKIPGSAPERAML